MASSSLDPRAAAPEPARGAGSATGVPGGAAGTAAPVDDLVRAARAGSREAFGQLVERHADGLFAYLHLRCASREDAEELTQEAFLRAWSKLDTYRPDWRFSTWLYTVARRLAISHHRANGRRPAGVELAEDARDPSPREPGRGLDEHEQRTRLWSLAERELPEQHLTALWLRYAEDLGIDEIAAALDRPPTTVRVWLHRARQRLARSLETAEGATERAPSTLPTDTRSPDAHEHAPDARPADSRPGESRSTEAQARGTHRGPVSLPQPEGHTA